MKDNRNLEENKNFNGIKFSYQEGSNHVFGVSRIPEDITEEEAKKMVLEGKAQFENIDKYFDKV